MKTFFTILFITLVFIYISGFHLKLKPFKMSFDDLPLGLGYVFLAVGLVFFQYSNYESGKKAGYQKAVDEVNEMIEKIKNKEKSETTLTS